MNHSLSQNNQNQHNSLAYSNMYSQKQDYSMSQNNQKIQNSMVYNQQNHNQTQTTKQLKSGLMEIPNNRSEQDMMNYMYHGNQNQSMSKIGNDSVLNSRIGNYYNQEQRVNGFQKKPQGTFADDNQFLEAHFQNFNNAPDLSEVLSEDRQVVSTKLGSVQRDKVQNFKKFVAIDDPTMVSQIKPVQKPGQSLTIEMNTVEVGANRDLNGQDCKLQKFLGS